MFVSKNESIVNLAHVSLVMINDNKIDFYGEPQNEQADLDDLPLIESYIYKTDIEATKAYEEIKKHISSLQI